MTPNSALVGFARDPATGALTFVDGDFFWDRLLEDPVSNGLLFPMRFSIDPSGKHIYTSGTASNAVSVFGPEPPVIERVEILGDQITLRLTNLSPGVRVRIEAGSDLRDYPEVETFVPDSMTFEWSAPVGEDRQKFFRAAID